MPLPVTVGLVLQVFPCGGSGAHKQLVLALLLGPKLHGLVLPGVHLSLQLAATTEIKKEDTVTEAHLFIASGVLVYVIDSIKC